MVGWPMERLEGPEGLVSECEVAVRALGAEVAWLGPSVWQAPTPLFNAASNEVNLGKHGHARHPLVGAPSVEAHASPFHHAASEQGVDLFDGILAPAWTMWLTSSIARRVRKFPGERSTRDGTTRLSLTETVPFEMNERNYQACHAAWQSMGSARLQLEPPAFAPNEQASAEHTLWHGYLGRLADPTYNAARVTSRNTLRRAGSAKSRQVDAEIGLDEALRKRPDHALAAAERLAVDGSLRKALWSLANAFPNLLKAGHASNADVQSWLRRGLDAGLPGSETQLAERMANAAVAAKLNELAFEALMMARPAKPSARAEWVKRLERISPVRRLRRDERWKTLS